MKVNIQKLQAGGGLGMLFSAVADPSSNAAQQSGTQSSSKKDSSDDGILSKEVLNELRKHGLPNEVDAFEQVLASLENKIANGQRITSSQLAGIRSMANRIIKQSSYLDTAITTAKDNKSLGDIAIDQDGFIYALNQEGKVQKVAFNKFDATKYNALSYAELAEYRRNSPELINNPDIIKSIQSSIGSEKINDFIQGILSKVGETQGKQEFYESLQSIKGINVKEASAHQIAALQAVAQASDKIGLDAIFKTGEFRKNSNVGIAMDYIMSILPKQMQAQLQGQFIANGGTYQDSKSKAAQVVYTAATMAANNTYEFGTSYDASINKAAGTSSGKEKTYYTNPMEVFWDGDLNKTNVTISDPSSKNKYGLSAIGNEWGVLIDDKGKDVTHVPLSFGLNQGMSKYLDLNQVYIGDKRVDASELQNIAYENAKIAAVWLPIDSDGKIDWQGFKAYSMAEKEIHDKQVTDPKEKAKIHAAKGSYITYNSEGKPVAIRKTEKFFMTHGYTSGNIVGDSDLNIELTGSKEDAAEEIIDSIYGKNLSKITGIGGIRGKHWWNNIYTTPVFIKASKTATMDARIASGHGPQDAAHSIEDFKVQQEMTREPDQQIYPKSAAFYTE